MGEVLVLANGVEARSFLSTGAILSVENGQKVSAGLYLYRIDAEGFTDTKKMVLLK